MLFQINFKSAKAVYLQLVDQVKTAVASGALRAGDPLPAIRPLAEELRVNRNTVAKAYTELERQGVDREPCRQGLLRPLGQLSLPQGSAPHAAGRRPGRCGRFRHITFKSAEPTFSSWQRSASMRSRRGARAPRGPDTMENTAAIEIRGLVRKYGRTDAVNGLSLRVAPGRCYGFFGRNGAGKTTTIKCLLNLLRPTAGEVRVFGLDPARAEVEVKSRLAYVPDVVAFYPWMTVRQALDYAASFRAALEPRDRGRARSASSASTCDRRRATCRRGSARSWR